MLPDVLGAKAAGHRVALITDTTVASFHIQRLMSLVPSAEVFTIPPGEEHKTRETWAALTDMLLERGLGRDTVVVAFGGGVVGDVAGFVAATFMRGVPVIQMPTTLLAMVDASVGGKTGVDTPAGKNLVGAFYQPVAVLIDPHLLATLPPEHLRAGFAEIVKHGVVADADYFEHAARFATSWKAGPRVTPELTDLIARSIDIKASIVSRDEREAGLRKVLNFGHTIGHAIEAATRFETLHGHAVALGMLVEARVAERIGVAEPGIAQRIEEVCENAGLRTRTPDLPLDQLLAYTRADKKARGGRVEYALPARIGAMAGEDLGWSIPVDESVVREALSR